MEDDKPRSGVAGVVWSNQNKKWYAYINIDKIHHHLGSFLLLDDAVLVRYLAEEKMGRDLYIGDSPAKRYLLDKGLLKE